MREIKFRAWDKRTNEMIVGNRLLNCYGEHLFLNPKEIVPMQYTGLKDKNGKEIYEGDIVLKQTETEYEKWATDQNQSIRLRTYLDIVTKKSEDIEMIDEKVKDFYKAESLRKPTYCPHEVSYNDIVGFYIKNDVEHIHSDSEKDYQGESLTKNVGKVHEVIGNIYENPELLEGKE